jgi:hypothetical protein
MNHGTKSVLAVRHSSQPLLRVDQASNGGAASITVNPPSGQKGTHVMLSGMSLQAGDTSCTIISPSPQFVVGYRCSVGLGGYVTGSFTVGDVQPGVYIILVIGSQGNPTGDFAQATFNVVAAGSQASPQDNNPGSHSCPHGYTWTTSGCIPLGHPLSCPPNYYTNESGKCVPLPPSIP